MNTCYYGVKVPYKLDIKKSKTSILIKVELLMNDKGVHWTAQLVGDDGIESLNHWLDAECYDDSVLKFPTYSRLMEFLTGLKKDIDEAWANYNEEKKHNIGTVFKEIERLFESVEGKEEKNKRKKGKL